MKIALLLLSLAGTALAQRFQVTMIDQKVSDSEYAYQVPGSVTTTSSANASCTSGPSTANCTAHERTEGTITAPRDVSYNATGATLTLRVPDGRFVVVNCSHKVNWGTGMPIRSCRIPLVETFDADFKGKNAKLSWPVSLDGKKTESETYTILAILAGSSGKN